MASNSEKTFGSKIFNAEQLATHLATFSGYTEVSPECSLVNYLTFIQDVKNNNASIATTSSQFSIAVEQRQALFTKNVDSLNKTLAPISAYIKAKFGVNSKEAKDIAALIIKIRGESSVKLKKNAEGEFVSQSQRSYGSITSHFADIIGHLTNYGANYSPANGKLLVPQLTSKLTDLTNANTTVTTSYNALKTAKDIRDVQYSTLSERSITIKNTVKSQYGFKSTEYNLIKSYKI